MVKYKDDYEEYLEWERKQNSSWNKFSKQVNPVQILVFVIILLGGNYLVSQGKIESSYFWIFVIAAAVIIIFLIKRGSTSPTLIPEHIIKQIANEALLKKREKGIEIPFDAKVNVTLVGEAIWEQDMIAGTSNVIKRDVGFEVTRKGYKKTGVIGIHPYNGTVLGIRWEKLGYSGKSGRDRVIVPVGVINTPQPPTKDSTSPA
jgi:hypothetical protein